MRVTLVVVLVAVAAGALAFAVSARHHLELDGTAELGRMPRVRRFLGERFDRQSMRGLLVTVSFLVVLLVALAVGVLLDMVATHEGLAEYDDDIAEWGSKNATSEAVDVMRLVTTLGSTWVLTIVLAATALGAWLRRRTLVPLAFLAVVGVGQVLLVNLLKVIIDRDRPDVLQLVAVRGPSFPSGHSAGAAACWAAVAIVLGSGRGRRTQAALVAGAVLIAVAVATSRALLGVHWLTDVLAGLAVGWGWCALVAVAFRTRLSASPARRRPAGSSP
jgi:membrane-associated phospholipid phosphatase